MGHTQTGWNFGRKQLFADHGGRLMSLLTVGTGLPEPARLQQIDDMMRDLSLGQPA